MADDQMPMQTGKKPFRFFICLLLQFLRNMLYYPYLRMAGWLDKPPGRAPERKQLHEKEQIIADTVSGGSSPYGSSSSVSGHSVRSE